MYNPNSLDTLAAALAKAIGADVPNRSAAPSAALRQYVEDAFCGQGADRILMYNPDAIAQWIYEKYRDRFAPILAKPHLELPFRTVMPSVTPVCFGTMYTGAQPEVHGIRSYAKPVIAIDSLFDALIRAEKRPAIVSTAGDSMSKIFLERKMDYFIYETPEEVNEKALSLIREDRYDLICIYNGNYDYKMHKFGPESKEAMEALDHNIHSYLAFSEAVEECWRGHNTLLGFAMDHGCHEVNEDSGTHGLDMEEDLNIVHLYRAIPKEA
ncbi:MAG: hypothetical protein IKC69_03515 [Clostridia bacterium]|nr:hypothetical protein [Clostridia bacterium]